MSASAIDVKEIIRKYSIEELNKAAEEYWVGMRTSRDVQAKPYVLGGIQHLLVQIAHLVGGLALYPGLTVLDFGAGTCYSSRILNQLGMRVISCDVSRTALEMGKELSAKYPPIGAQPEHLFLPFDGKRFDLPDGSVDRVFCLDAFHHVPYQVDILREMARVLTGGGIAGFSEPGPTHSLHPDSQFAMRNHTVIENDIVLPEIFENGKRFGFTEMKIAVAPIHPTMVPIGNLDGFFANPAPFVAGIKDRVLNYPIFFLYKGSPKVSDSRVGDELVGVLKSPKSEIVGNSRTPVRFEVRAENCSSKVWRASGPNLGCVNLGAFLHSAEPHQGIARSKQYRWSLSLRDVQPGETVGALVDLGLLKPGAYTLDVDLVSEHVCWFERNCNSKVTLALRIQP
jgi:SAM-dependent methyltransferase